MDNNRPYVFISYAHVDSNVVFPCIEAMKKDGVNLWFDEGIEAGSEWPEFIAQKVVECSKFVLFVSDAYLKSQNCKRELNFAISRKKDILSVFIQDVQLSPGMEMQLGTYQALYRKRFDSDNQFFSMLGREHFFDSCRFDDVAGVKQEAPKEPEKRESNPAGIPYVHTNSNVQQNTNVQSNPVGQTNNNQSTLTDKVNTIGKSVAEEFGSLFGSLNPQKESNTNMASPLATQSLPKKSRIIAVLLAFFFGAFGAQKFYLGQIKWGIVYAVLCFTYIPYILSIIEMILLIVSPQEKLRERYKIEFTT